MVAIIGNDAVLAAAPATPVQLAHACLRRGFAVAVPASWGDELIAAEAVRRLASRERGPAVMCVCPFARSRLLAPGPDLEPFLVSLVSPPVATARYLRAVYGDHGVHITYIGGCPSAEDGSIDVRLTPDAFLADLAEQGIALSEQPLVFDSIVPPDRRRWCSLPGGAPTAEILWADSDTRTLIEIDREDVSTDLAQHIITHEHVLLDLAPGLGCVCSGAIGSLPSRSARGTVTALEPPRALGPIIDPTPLVSLDVAVGQPPAVVPPVGPSSAGSQHAVSREDRLDELLGSSGSELAVEIDVEVALHTSRGNLDDAPAPPNIEAPASIESSEKPAVAAPTPTDGATAESRSGVATEATAQPAVESVASASESERVADPIAPAIPAPSVVRRRTPAPMPAHHPASAIPRATASDGRVLPRAYVAKRRTPSTGVPLVAEAPQSMGAASEPPESQGDVSPAAPGNEASSAGNDQPAVEAPVADQPPPPQAESVVAAVEQERPAATAPERSEPPRSSASAGPSDAPGAPRSVEKQPRPDAKPAGGAVTATDTNPSALVALLVALIALGFFVVRALH
jgi:hypothetical protein